jgi:hypothetical protein
MVWFFNKDKSKKTSGGDKRTHEGANVKNTGGKDQINNEGSLKSQRPDSAQIRAQALANARKAREAIGDETLQKIAAAMQKKQQSATEQAKRQIAEADADRVAEEILAMLETRH